MTPPEVDEMDDDTYYAFADYMRDELKARKQAANKKSR
jgi:hypothetical protein